MERSTMTPRTRSLALAGVLALTLTVGAAAFAVGGPLGALAATGTPTTGQGTQATPGTATTGQGSPADFYAKLAANLGIGQDTLAAAVQQTDQQQIDAALAAGTLTPARAQAARDRLAASPNGLPPFGIGEGRGGRGGHGEGDEGALLSAEAAFFGITPAQFQHDLAAGSLQGVAAKYGKDNATDQAALEAALEAALRQDLTTRGVATAQIEQEIARFKQGFDQFYTSTREQHGPRGTEPATSPAPATPAASQ
jgi:hypothetical protein